MNTFLKLLACSYLSSLGAMELSVSPIALLESQEVCLATYLMCQVCDTRQASNLVGAVKSFKEYGQRYPKGPVFAAVHARLGDFYREAHALDKSLLEKKMVFGGDNLKLAEQSYLKALSHKGALDDALAWAGIQLGYMYILQRKYKEAQSNFERARCKVSPDLTPSLLNGLGVSYYVDARPDDAYSCWSKVIKSNNTVEKSRALHNCAILSQDQGKFELALKCINRAKKHGFQYNQEEYAKLVSAIELGIKSLASQ